MFRKPPTLRRAPAIEALEPRLLFSADAVGAADAVAAAWVASVPSEAIAWQGRSAAEGGIGADTEPASRGEAAAPARELALVDARVPDADRLLAELHAQRDAGRPIDVVMVGEGDDAIAALGTALSGAGAGGAYRAVHLFGHGEPGSMQLGDGALDLATLRARAGEVAGWSLGLAEDADLLLWGCDAGAGPEGAALLDALSALTGADVAASTDATGGLAAGGDWELEAERGPIETTAPIGAALRAEFAGRLGLTPGPTGEVAVAPAQSPQENTGTLSTAGRQVAAGEAGTVLVWIDVSGERILAQRYGADGSLRGGVLTIDDDDDAGARMPAVAMDDAGNVLVAWSNADGEVRALYVSAAEADGGRTNFDGASSKVNMGYSPARVPGQVSVDLSPNGQRAVVVWVETGFDRRDISARRLSIDPTSGVSNDGSKIEITREQGLLDEHPDAGIADDGAIIAVLRSYSNASDGDSGIFSYRVAAGSGVATPSAHTTIGDRVSPSVPYGPFFQIAPAFALGTDGRGLAVWVDTRSGTSLWARVIGPGGPTGAAVQIPTDPGHTIGRPSVAAAADGGWVVAWDTASGSGYGIRVIRVDATGTPDADTRTVVDSTINGDRRAPSVAVAGSRMVIAWTGPGGGQGGTSALVMRTFALGGALEIDAVPSVAVLENAAATPVALRATVDGTPQTGVTWSLAPDAPAGLVTIDAATGVLTVVAGLDYETLAGGTVLDGGQRAYDVGVTAAIGGAAPRTATSTVRVVLGNVREAPQPTMPPTLAAVEDVARVLSGADGSAVSVDADAAATRLELVLSVDRGTLTLGAFAGLDFSGGTDGTNDATIHFGGSPAAVAAALASLTFRPPTDASGAATITLSVTDPGLVGPASQATIALTIDAVNDAPVAGPLAQPVSVEAGSLAAVAPAALVATDVDDGPERIVYELADASPLGDLLFDDVAMEVGRRFTQADVDLGRVSFAAREAGTATVSLRLADAAGAMAGTTTLTFEVEARPAAPVPAADVPAPAADVPTPEAPVEAAAPAAPRAAAASPTFVMARAAPSFASLSSATQSDGADAGSTRALAAQASQQASDGGTAPSPGLSAGAASAQPANVTVRVGSGGTGAVAAAAVPGAAAVAAAAVGSAQSGPSAPGGLQAVASVASVAAFAGAQGPSAAGAQLAWHDAASDAASDAPGAAGSAAGAGSSAGSGGAGGWSRARSGAGSATALPIDAWSPAVALRQADFRAELAQTRDDAVARFDTDRTLVASSVAVSTSLSIGYVVWLARGGVLLTSLLASMPAWRSIDPLPVLARVDARGRDDAENDDSLRGLLKHAADRRAALAEAQAESEAQGIAQVAPDPA
jgi:hypothetical protein